MNDARGSFYWQLHRFTREIIASSVPTFFPRVLRNDTEASTLALQKNHFMKLLPGNSRQFTFW